MSRNKVKGKPRVLDSGDGTPISKSAKHLGLAESRSKAKPSAQTRLRLTIRDLGWTREQAMQVRAKLSSFAPDWDDPGMDIYNEP